jgi:hypothetical protein
MTPFHRLRFFFAFFLLLLGMMSCVSAFTLSSVTVNPQGDQAAGTPMTVRSVIDFSSAGSETFPNASELQMSTDLADPYWVPVLILDGKETRLEIKAGEELILAGWYLSYASSQNVQLLVTVTGNIPMNPTTRQNLLKIQERDADKNIVSTAHVAMPEAPGITLSSLSTPTKKPTTKKIFTPIPTATPTQESPVGIEVAVVAAAGAALLVVRRR